MSLLSFFYLFLFMLGAKKREVFSAQILVIEKKKKSCWPRSYSRFIPKWSVFLEAKTVLRSWLFQSTIFVFCWLLKFLFFHQHGVRLKRKRWIYKYILWYIQKLIYNQNCFSVPHFVALSHPTHYIFENVRRKSLHRVSWILMVHIVYDEWYLLLGNAETF